MDKIFAYMERYRMIEEHDRVIVGVSGGADSVCLLFVLKKYQEKVDFSIQAVHVEHGIRGEAGREDARFAEKLCAAWGIPFRFYAFNVPVLAKVQKLSVEEAARKVRHQAFEDALSKFSGNKIAVAHHIGDQAETVLWNLVRGSGLRGISGMWPVQNQMIRPLLGVTKKEIEKIAEDAGLQYCQDETNFQDTYTRNKLRLHIIPYMERELNPMASEHIAALCTHVQKAEAFLEEEGMRRARELGDFGKERVELQRSAFLEQEEVMQYYIIRACLFWLDPGLKNITREHYEAIRRLAGGQSGKQLFLPGCMRVRNQNGKMMIGTRDAVIRQSRVLGSTDLVIPGTVFFHDWKIVTEIDEYKNQVISKKKYTKWFDYDTIKGTIKLRSRKSGDYLTVNDTGGHKKLKNYFIDEKIASEERDEILLLAEDSHILWVAGYRISETYKITENTKRILKIQIMEVTHG